MRACCLTREGGTSYPAKAWAEFEAEICLHVWFRQQFSRNRVCIQCSYIFIVVTGTQRLDGVLLPNNVWHPSKRYLLQSWICCWHTESRNWFRVPVLKRMLLDNEWAGKTMGSKGNVFNLCGDTERRSASICFCFFTNYPVLWHVLHNHRLCTACDHLVCIWTEAIGWTWKNQRKFYATRWELKRPRWRPYCLQGRPGSFVCPWGTMIIYNPDRVLLRIEFLNLDPDGGTHGPAHSRESRRHGAL